MSAVIKTTTPFIDLECLCKALEAIGCDFQVKGEKIITNRKDPHLDFQEFRKDEYGKYALYAYSYLDKNQAEFIRLIEKHYNDAYQKKLEELELKRLEEERIRLEKERQEFIEKQKATIIQKAKEKGYTVKEEYVKGKVKLVLVRNTY